MDFAGPSKESSYSKKVVYKIRSFVMVVMVMRCRPLATRKMIYKNKKELGLASVN